MRTLVAALVMWVALVAWAVLGKAAHANGTSVQLAATADFLADVVADYESAKNKKQPGRLTGLRTDKFVQIELWKAVTPRDQRVPGDATYVDPERVLTNYRSRFDNSQADSMALLTTMTNVESDAGKIRAYDVNLAGKSDADAIRQLDGIIASSKLPGNTSHTTVTVSESLDFINSLVDLVENSIGAKWRSDKYKVIPGERLAIVRGFNRVMSPTSTSTYKDVIDGVVEKLKPDRSPLFRNEKSVVAEEKE